MNELDRLDAAPQSVDDMNWCTVAVAVPGRDVAFCCSGLLQARSYIQLLTVEFAFDLGSGLRWGKPTVPCLQPVIQHAVQGKFILLSKGQYLRDVFRLLVDLCCFLPNISSFALLKPLQLAG
jgi:hypothetical protein